MDFNKDTLAQLSQLSDAELTALLANQIRLKQANGTLGDVEKMVRLLSPLLSDEQKSRLIKILEEVQKQ